MKRLATEQELTNKTPLKQRASYVAPAVIYEGRITARAGTVIGDKPDGSAVDPTDLFGGN